MRAADLPRSPRQLVAGWRYAWPVLLERAVTSRSQARAAVLDRLDGGLGEPPPLVLLCVYRKRNARSLRLLLSQLGRRAEVRLWALDEVEPSLAPLTVGSGAAPKFVLVNRLLRDRPVGDDAYVAIADDDVCFAAGTLDEAVAVAARRGLDLFQPSHSWASIFTYPLLLQRPWLEARETGFVESGPLFVVGPAWRHRILPLPEDIGMGWGVEVAWHGLRAEGCHLGVIDACRVVHLQPVGKAYDPKTTKVTLERLLAAQGLRSVYDLMTTVRRWRAAG